MIGIDLIEYDEMVRYFDLGSLAWAFMKEEIFKSYKVDHSEQKKVREFLFEFAATKLQNSANPLIWEETIKQL